MYSTGGSGHLTLGIGSMHCDDPFFFFKKKKKKKKKYLNVNDKISLLQKNVHIP